MTDSQCRFCLEDIDPDDCGSSLFDKRLRLAMAGVFSFEIPFRRDLPMYTCKRCSWNVMDFHDYCKAVQKNQEKLEQEFNLDDEFEIEENLPIESNDTDDAKEEAASSTDCEASYSIKPEYSADGNIHLSPVAITPAIMPAEDDDSEDDVKVAYECHPDFESVNREETSESEEQLSISSVKHKILSSSEEAVKTLASEDSPAAHNSVNASISNEEAPDLSFDQPETEPKEKCLRRSSRFSTQSKSSASSNNRVLERKRKSVGERSHFRYSGKSLKQRSVCKKGAMPCEESEDSPPIIAAHNSVNASISNEEAPDLSFDQPETEPKEKCLRRSSRFTTQSKSSASSNNRVLERKPKSVGKSVCRKGVVRRSTEHVARVFRCDICEKVFAHKTSLKFHTDVHHTPNTANAAKHVCDLCGKSFLRKRRLQYHKRCHKFVECPVSKKAKYEKTLTEHIAAHEGAFRCDVCDKTYISKRALKCHKDGQHPSDTAEGAKYSCDKCDKSFFTKSQLRNHQRYHQVLDCPVCKKSFPKHKLRHHIAAHEGAFRCGVCEKLFSTKYSLNFHENSQHPLTLRTD